MCYVIWSVWAPACLWALRESAAYDWRRKRKRQRQPKRKAPTRATAERAPDTKFAHTIELLCKLACRPLYASEPFELDFGRRALTSE